MAIKRDELFKPFTHNIIMVYCFRWKIKTGCKSELKSAALKFYSDWFYQNHLLPPFEVEEKYVFTISGNDHEFGEEGAVQNTWS